MKQKLLLFLFAILIISLTACGSGFSGDAGAAPRISSFLADDATLFIDRSKTTTSLTVDASGDGRIESYSYEIVSDTSGGTLTGSDTAVGKYYNAGASTGIALVKVTVTDDNGQAAEETVKIRVVNSIQKISDTTGGFKGSLDGGDRLGVSVAAIGDVNGDGITDLAAGAYQDDDGGPDSSSNNGAVWILFMNDDYTVKDYQKISCEEGGVLSVPVAGDEFGVSVAGIGDLDKDGIPDIAVGAIGCNDGGTDAGAVWIFLLNRDGTVKKEQLLCASYGGITAPAAGDYFGISVTAIGDLDQDGVTDIAVGAHGVNHTYSNEGEVRIFFLNSDGTVKKEQKIGSTEGNFSSQLSNFDHFGYSVAGIGDIDGDTIPDLAVGEYTDNQGDSNAGALWILFLNSDGTVKDKNKIYSLPNETLYADDNFGQGCSAIGDINKDGVNDVAVGIRDNTNGSEGAIWILFLNIDGTVKDEQKISSTAGDFNGDLDNSDRIGRGIGCLGDLNGDGLTEIVTGAYEDDDGNTNAGALWIMHLEADGTVLH
ncbi:MAG: hypothetical protein GY765_41650 [bacterium]|nr:hypothetical protein [bacterium]